MHELGITRNVVSIVSERAAGQKVLRVTLEVGRLSGMLSDAIRFCFDICAKGTSLDGATPAPRVLAPWPPRIRRRRYCTGDGFKFQISFAYSVIVRSLENFPQQATLMRAFLAQASGSA